jgi:hypothetical protein
LHAHQLLNDKQETTKDKNKRKEPFFMFLEIEEAYKIESKSHNFIIRIK